MLLLQAHYRSPVRIGVDNLEAAEKALAGLDSFAARTAGADAPTPIRPCSDAFRERDGRRPRHARRRWPCCSTRCGGPTPRSTPAMPRAGALVAAVREIADAVGLVLGRRRRGAGRRRSERAAALDAARAAKDFATADAIRAELQAAGWIVETTPTGTAVRK